MLTKVRMINLLPPQEKEKLLFEGKKKLTIVLGNMVLISLILLVLVLFALKFYVLKQLVSEKINLSSVQEDYQNLYFMLAKDNMQKYNAIIIKMNNFYKNQMSLSDSLNIVSKINKPKGLYFKSINLENGDNNTINVKIAGFSDTRENLQAFRNNIEAMQQNHSTGKIENIYFPAEVWLKPKDVDFNLTFNIVKDENMQ